jgi:cyanate permease
MKYELDYQEKTQPYEAEGGGGKRYRWVMLALLWLLYVSFGLVSRSLAPLVTPILEDLDISYTQMGLIFGSWPLVYIAAAVFAGNIIDRWGVRKSLFAGALIMCLSAALRYFAINFTVMLILVALFGLGGPMISIGCPKTISLWFTGRDRGTAVGIYMTGPWIGGLLALSLTNSLLMPLTGYSWRLTFVSYGLFSLVIALLWWFLARDVKGGTDEEEYSLSRVFVRFIKVRNIQLILAMGLLSFAVMHGIANWLPRILETRGLSPAIAGFASSVPLISGIPSVLIIPRLVPPQLRSRFIALFALAATLALAMVATSSGILTVAALALFGIAGYSFMPLLMLILMDSPEVSEKYMGAAGGMFFCVAEIGGFSGPLIVGSLVGFTGSFLTGVFFLAALNLAVLALALLLKRQPADQNKIS